MLKLSDKYHCSGCGVCADVCPALCIEYKHDSKGFIYPVIDADACINCGACERVCPIKPENISTREPVSCHAVWAKDENIHRTSSSGGMGYVLAKEILGRGGVVYGCSAENPLHVRHIRVEEESDLAKLQGSKYVQSDTRGIYKQLKLDVKSGREVLFVGTPCQVSAVNHLFRKNPDNLYTVDLICHGVPSQKMLNSQIAGLHKGDPETISFRNGNNYRMDLTFADNKTFSDDYWRIPYFRAFFNGYSFRNSCYKCPYAGEKRAGDMTIGDFWGIKNPEDLPVDYSNGISAVFVSTPEGDRLLEAVASRIEMQRRPVREAVEGNDQLRHPVPETFRAKLFRILYPAFPLGIAVTLCVADKKFVALTRIISRQFKS